MNTSQLRTCLKMPERGCVVSTSRSSPVSPRSSCFCGWSATQPRSFLRQTLKKITVATLLAGTVFVAHAALKVGDGFPALTSYQLEGKLPDSLKGKVVIVDFWASWCGPCKESFPVMNELQKKYGDQGLVIIAVNEDEQRSDMQDFLEKHQATFTVVRDAKQKLVAVAGIQTMPSSFLLDADGKVRFAHSGFHGAETRKAYEQEIESLLKK